MTIARLRPDGLVRSPSFSHVGAVPPGATPICVGGQNGVDAERELVGEGVARLEVPGALVEIGAVAAVVC